MTGTPFTRQFKKDCDSLSEKLADTRTRGEPESTAWDEGEHEGCGKDTERAMTHDDIVARLYAACNGHPHAKIAWPHRLLHDAVKEIETLRANAETRPSVSAGSAPPAVLADPVEFNEYAIPNSERTLPPTPLLRCEPVSERALSDRQIGKRLGVRDAITCLHDRAKEMNDPQAKAVLDSAAFNLGVDQSQGRISKAVNDALTRAEES